MGSSSTHPESESQPSALRAGSADCAGIGELSNRHQTKLAEFEKASDGQNFIASEASNSTLTRDERQRDRFRLFALAFPFKAIPDLVDGNVAERQACGSFKLSNIHSIL